MFYKHFCAHFGRRRVRGKYCSSLIAVRAHIDFGCLHRQYIDAAHDEALGVEALSQKEQTWIARICHPIKERCFSLPRDEPEKMSGIAALAGPANLRGPRRERARYVY